jgi:polysaccharide pyruvyl transferase WcaK-like protein
MRHKIHSNSTEDTLRFLEQLSRLRLLVSGRFHACTLALITDTPFVAMASNTKKIESFIKDVGLESWRSEIELRPGDIHEAMERGWSGQERESISEYLAHARQSTETLFRDLRALLT